MSQAIEGSVGRNGGSRLAAAPSRSAVRRRYRCSSRGIPPSPITTKSQSRLPHLEQRSRLPHVGTDTADPCRSTSAAMSASVRYRHSLHQQTSRTPARRALPRVIRPVSLSKRRRFMVQSLTSGAVTLAGIAGKIMRLRANESRATLESTNLR
jgi:hypothetical protein